MAELCPHGRHEGAVCIPCGLSEKPARENVKKPVQPSEAQDNVNEPFHYMVGGFEAIDILEAKLTRDQFIGFLKGNVLKYQMRANYKGNHDEDCKKAAWYSQRLAEYLDSNPTM